MSNKSLEENIISKNWGELSITEQRKRMKYFIDGLLKEARKAAILEAIEILEYLLQTEEIVKAEAELKKLIE